MTKNLYLGHIAPMPFAWRLTKVLEISIPCGNIVILLHMEIIIAHDVALLLTVEIAEDFTGIAEVF